MKNILKELKNFFKSNYGVRSVGALTVGAVAWYLASALAGFAVAAAIGTGFGAAALALSTMAAFYWKNSIKSWLGFDQSVTKTIVQTEFAHFNPTQTSSLTQAQNHFDITPTHNKKANGEKSQFYWPKTIVPSEALEKVAVELNKLVYVPKQSAPEWQDRFFYQNHIELEFELAAVINFIDNHRGIKNNTPHQEGLNFYDENTQTGLNVATQELSNALTYCSASDIDGLSYFTRGLSSRDVKTSFDAMNEHFRDSRHYLLSAIDSKIVKRLHELRNADVTAKAHNHRDGNTENHGLAPF